MVSAPGGFPFDTNVSISLFLFLFQPPEAPVTLTLFPDALCSLGELWESQLSIRACYEGCGICAEERADGAAAQHPVRRPDRSDTAEDYVC